MFKQLKKEFGIDGIKFADINVKAATKQVQVAQFLNIQPPSDSKDAKPCPEIEDGEWKAAAYIWNICDNQGKDKQSCLDNAPKYGYMTEQPTSDKHLREMQKKALGCK